MYFLPSFRDKNSNAGPQKVKENLLHDSFMLKFWIGAVKMHQYCKNQKGEGGVKMENKKR